MSRSFVVVNPRPYALCPLLALAATGGTVGCDTRARPVGEKHAYPGFIPMTSYEMTVRGEGEPASEFTPSVADVLGVVQDGSVSIRIPTGESTGSFLKSIPPEKITRFEMHSSWYLDDFGGV